jgi:hypothetical protein
VIVHALRPDEWAEVSESTHLVAFNEKRDPSLNRVDFALMATDGDDPVAYMTCYEHDAETVYIQHGGKLPDAGGSVKAFKAYMQMLGRLNEMGFKFGQTMIENTNTAMLRIAMKAGWLISGIRFFDGKILVEHAIQFKNKED